MASSYSNYHPVDSILSSLAQEAVQGEGAFVANQIFETVQTPERSGTLLIEASRNFTGAGAGLSFERAPGASRVRIGGFDRSSTTFKALNYGLEDVIAMEELEDSQFPGSEEQRLVKKVARALMINREKRAADLLFNTTTFSPISPTTKFNSAGGSPLDYLHSTPIETVFSNAHGIYPDTMILGHGVFRALSRNPEIRGIAGGGYSSGFTTGQYILSHEDTIGILRAKLGIENIYVAEARQDTAVPGATSSEAFIWDTESIWVGILKGSDAITNRSGVKIMPTAALNFKWKDMQAGQYDSLDLTRRHVWAEESCLYKIIDANYGVLVNNCLA
tara:strand:+ start:1285 stop:2280 length:996 start_codon:yes stop_codon:yes gene_type:complete